MVELGQEAEVTMIWKPARDAEPHGINVPLEWQSLLGTGVHMNILGEPSVSPLSFSQAMFWPTGLKYMVRVEMQIQRQEERSKSFTFKQIHL